MTAPRDPDRLIAAFLEDGTDVLPDWAYDEVRHDIHRTRQRTVIGPWREPVMSNLVKYGVIAAAVVLFVGAGAYLLRPAPTAIVGTPSPTPASAPTPVPNAVGPGPVELRYGPWSMTVTVPEGAVGWSQAEGDSGLFKDYGPDGEEDGPVIIIWSMTGTYVDPCLDHTLKQPDPEGVEELIAALGNQPGLTSGPPTDVTIDGYDGQYVETTVTADLSTCADNDGFWIWASPIDHRFVSTGGEVNRMYALDVDGEIFTFDVRLPAAVTDEDRATVEQMLGTLDIESLAASPSP
jgi:hypothetical protein